MHALKKIHAQLKYLLIITHAPGKSYIKLKILPFHVGQETRFFFSFVTEIYF